METITFSCKTSDVWLFQFRCTIAYFRHSLSLTRYLFLVTCVLFLLLCICLHIICCLSPYISTKTIQRIFDICSNNFVHASFHSLHNICIFLLVTRRRNKGKDKGEKETLAGLVGSMQENLFLHSCVSNCLLSILCTNLRKRLPMSLPVYNWCST